MKQTNNKLTNNKPKDDASTNFEVDRWIPYLIEANPSLAGQSCNTASVCVEEKVATTRDPLFGLVLVANWPPKDSMVEAYTSLVPKIKECFDPQDHVVDDIHRVPAVYVYPPSTLHITVATFTPFFTPPPTSEPDAAKKNERYARACTEIMNRCHSRNDWPKEPLIVEIEAAQIGSKAGIFLWKNQDERIETIRNIIQEEYHSMIQEDPEAFHQRQLIIPNIIHSTFLRFGRMPATKGEVVQNRFQNAIIGIREVFGKVDFDNMRLTLEKIPYMHIPCDERHVLASFMTC